MVIPCTCGTVKSGFSVSVPAVVGASLSLLLFLASAVVGFGDSDDILRDPKCRSDIEDDDSTSLSEVKDPVVFLEPAFVRCTVDVDGAGFLLVDEASPKKLALAGNDGIS